MIIVWPSTFKAATIAVVADCFGFAARDVRGPSRRRELVVARQIAMGILRHSPGLSGTVRSLPEIGRRFGRDHSTVVYGVRRYQGWCREAGLAEATDDPAAQTQALMAHLGIERIADPPPSESFPSSDDTAPLSGPRPRSRNLKSKENAVLVPGPIAVSDPDLGMFSMSAAEFDELPIAMRGEAARLACERFGSPEAAGGRRPAFPPPASGRPRRPASSHSPCRIRSD